MRTDYDCIFFTARKPAAEGRRSARRSGGTAVGRPPLASRGINHIRRPQEDGSSSVQERGARADGVVVSVSGYTRTRRRRRSPPRWLRAAARAEANASPSTIPSSRARRGVGPAAAAAAAAARARTATPTLRSRRRRPASMSTRKRRRDSPSGAPAPAAIRRVLRVLVRPRGQAPAGGRRSGVPGGRGRARRRAVARDDDGRRRRRRRRGTGLDRRRRRGTGLDAVPPPDLGRAEDLARVELPAVALGPFAVEDLGADGPDRGSTRGLRPGRARRRARARSALAAAAGFHVAPTTPAGRDHVAASASRGARGTGRYRGGGATRHGCRARRAPAPSGGGRRRRRGAAAPASSASSASAAAASASAAAAAAANRSRAAAAPAARASSAAAAAAADAEAAPPARASTRAAAAGPVFWRPALAGSSVSKASRTNLCGNQPVS